MNTDRRIVKVAISQKLLFEWLTQDNEIVGVVKTTKGLPKDTRFIGSLFDEKTMTAFIFCEHPDFPLVFLGGEIPFFDIQFTKYTPER